MLLVLSAAGPAAWGQRFGPVSAYSTGAGSTPYKVALKDVNGDGLLDIISAHSFSNSVGVLSGQAGGGFAALVSYPVGAETNGVAVGDINADGRWDIVVGSGTTVWVLPGQAGGGFAPASAYTAGEVTSGIGAVCRVVDVALGQAVCCPAMGAAASFRVETAGLAPGVYTLRLLAGGVALARRVVVE